MNAQLFRGRTLADARLAAHEKLGTDAVVLTTRPVRLPGVAGWLGKAGVELAAIPAEKAEPKRSPVLEVPFARGVYEAARGKPGNDLGALRAELKGDMRALRHLLVSEGETPNVASEIAQLRELLEAMALSPRAKSPRGDKAAARIRALGIEGPAAVALARSVRNAGENPALRAELGRLVPTSPFPIDGERSMIALVGPTGVGKTTTAAKLAARARMAGRSVTLVACDAYRVGAIAQLAQYARIMVAEFAEAKTSDDLRSILESARTDIVIVDTSGRPPTADGVELGIALSRKPARGVVRKRHVLLCVSASVRAHDAARIVRRFGTLSPTALAVTKLDETDTPAGIVHAAWAARLGVAVACNGQRVPEDIAAATTEALVESIASTTNESAAAA